MCSTNVVFNVHRENRWDVHMREDVPLQEFANERIANEGSCTIEDVPLQELYKQMACVTGMTCTNKRVRRIDGMYNSLSRSAAAIFIKPTSICSQAMLKATQVRSAYPYSLESFDLFKVFSSMPLRLIFRRAKVHKS